MLNANLQTIRQAIARCLALALLFCALLGASQALEAQQTHESLVEELETQKQLLQFLEERAQGVANESEDLAKDRWRLSESLRQLKKDRAITAAQMEEAEQQLRRIDTVLEGIVNNLERVQQDIIQGAQRVRQSLVLLLSLQQTERISGYLSHEFIKAFRMRRATLSYLKESLLTEQEQLNSRLSEQDQLYAELENAQIRQAAQVAEIREYFDILTFDEKSHLSSLSKLEQLTQSKQSQLAQIQQQEQDIAQQIARLEQEKTDFQKQAELQKSFIGFKKSKGRLVRPFSGETVLGFGAPQNRGLFRKGVVMQSEQAQVAVRATWAGTVVFIGKIAGFEQVVILDHGASSFSVYGLLQAVQVQKGQTLQAGAPIAHGVYFADRGLSQLYFELQHQGRPRDPRQWLTP